MMEHNRLNSDYLKKSEEKITLKINYKLITIKLFLLLFLFPFYTAAQSPALKYNWRKISGPAQFTIVSPNSKLTSIIHLTEGVYQFELMVTNSRRQFARDTVTVSVNPAQLITSSSVKPFNKTSLH